MSSAVDTALARLNGAELTPEDVDRLHRFALTRVRHVAEPNLALNAAPEPEGLPADRVYDAVTEELLGRTAGPELAGGIADAVLEAIAPELKLAHRARTIDTVIGDTHAPRAELEEAETIGRHAAEARDDLAGLLNRIVRGEFIGAMTADGPRIALAVVEVLDADRARTGVDVEWDESDPRGALYNAAYAFLEGADPAEA